MILFFQSGVRFDGNCFISRGSPTHLFRFVLHNWLVEEEEEEREGGREEREEEEEQPIK